MKRVESVKSALDEIKNSEEKHVSDIIGINERGAEAVGDAWDETWQRRNEQAAATSSARVYDLRGNRFGTGNTTTSSSDWLSAFMNRTEPWTTAKAGSTTFLSSEVGSKSRMTRGEEEMVRELKSIRKDQQELLRMG